MAENRHSSTDMDENLPLLINTPPLLPSNNKNPIQQAITQTFQSTAHLANLLPTGTVLTFQLLSPIFSNQGNCDSVTRTLTSSLIALCGISCFALSFTDSFRDKDGNVRYGFATPSGLWVIDGGEELPHDLAKHYKIKVVDFIHGLLSVWVFAAIALFDANVVHCFFPNPSLRDTELLNAVPVGIGVVSSMLFVVFPTKRHGIGFPLSAT